MKTRHSALIAVAAAAAVTLTACGGGGGGENEDVSFSDSPSGTLNAWGFNNADDVGQAVLDYAEGQLSDVDIQIDQTGFDAQKFTTRMASGDVPDVVQMDRRYVGTYAAQGLIMPLDECYAAHGVNPSERFYESVIGDVTYEDQVWGVPQFYQPPAIILNTRVMDAAGVTPDQIDTSNPGVLLDAIGKMYQESGGNPSVLGFDPVSTGQGGLWVLGMGGQLINDAGEPTLDDPANVEALNFLKEINDAQGGYAKVKSFSDTFDTFGDNNQYVTDQVGAQVNAQWYVNVLTPYVDQVQIAAVPFRNSEGEPFAVASGISFVIPAGAENPDAACAWALSLTSQDAWMAAGAARAETIASTPGAINTGLFTGSPEADEAIRAEFVTESGNAGFDQTIDTFYEAVSEGQTYGVSPAGQAIEGELNNAISSTLLGDKSAEEALADAQDAAQRAYDNAMAGQ